MTRPDQQSANVIDSTLAVYLKSQLVYKLCGVELKVPLPFLRRIRLGFRSRDFQGIFQFTAVK